MYVLAGHAVQAVEEASSEYVPEGHESQDDVRPLLLEYLPAAHEVHVVAPATAVNSQTDPMPPPQ